MLTQGRTHSALGEVRALVPLAIPLVFGQLFGIGTDVVISIFAGHLGAAVLAAVAVGSGVWIVVFMGVVGLMMSLQPAVSALDGADRRQEVGHLLAQGLTLGFGAGVLAALLLALGAPAFAHASGLPPRVLPGVVGFLRAAAWSMPALGLLAACRGVSEGLSMTRPTMICGAIGFVALLPVAYILVDGADLPLLGVLRGQGAQGAGLAITLIFWVQATAYLGWIRLSGRYPAGAWLIAAWRPDGRVLGRLLGVGTPIAASIMLEICMFSAGTVMAGHLGTVAVAGHQVALITISVFFMVPLGLSMAVTVRVGRAVGRGDRAGIRRAGLAGFAVMLASQCVSSALMLFASTAIAGIFTHAAPVIALASALLSLAALFQFADGTQVIAMASLRGLQDTRVPLVLAMLAYWLLGVPLAAFLTFGCGLGVRGIWLGLMAGITAAAVMLTTRFLRATRT
jgi:MATE family multidrug resistance protein